ncbi:MAG: flagellar hook-basal body complex protein FliE [Clostridia bacterium]|nr:flagellar hook-basal body complex protein FliE [Clostridia bacterium]
MSFQSIFKDAINDVKETNATLEDEAYRLATGQTDNLHDITIASTKASLSVELFVQLRNKALESYNSIMNMGI